MVCEEVPDTITKTMQRVGFRYVFTKEMQPSIINFPQPITRWVLERPT